MLHARRGDWTRGQSLTRRWRSPVEANELDTIGPVGFARAEARWLAGEAGLVAEETDDTLARARLSDHRWMIGELAIWRHRAGLQHADSERLPPPYRAELARDVRAAAEFWRARGCRYDAALALAAVTLRTTYGRACANCRA